MKNKHYYAEQSPRGFSNEIKTYRFATKAERDAWVGEHKCEGDVNSAARGARAISAKQARANVGYRGDEVTESFNSGFIDL
jgi:hypothetical protein